MHPVLSRFMSALVFTTGVAAAVGFIQAAPSHAQEEVIQEVLPVSTSVLAAIQEAPFSEVFAVTTVNGEVGYGVKDKDFDPRYDLVGFYSLWADAPEQDLLQAAVMYCILDPDLEGTELEALTLMDGETPLVTLDEKVVATDTQEFEIAPQQTVTTYADPYYSPYWGDAYYGLGGSTYTTTYVPAVDCSLGAARFDLLSVQAEIAQLPATTLNVELLFSNGQTEMWRLGQGSVEAIKTLPSLQ
ncbi:MAG: hypothetical protein F6K00_31940 [Leptolyngbya sp. SIOISBB]|nr:hypothetical protein [Leptolyngbya sp. SIOISBB]